MRKLKVFAAAGLLAASAIAPALADEAPQRRHHRHHYHQRHVQPLPYSISYLHNYGPGAVPGTFAYYDGPASVKCYQSAAAYIGQDHRRYPCF